jgi:hypothetical protein
MIELVVLAAATFMDCPPGQWCSYHMDRATEDASNERDCHTWQPDMLMIERADRPPLCTVGAGCWTAIRRDDGDYACRLMDRPQP